MFKNAKAAIFDLDGTLIDSMWIWDEVDNDYLKNRGLAIPKGLKDDISHLSFLETALFFKANFSIEDSPEEIMQEWNNMAFHKYSSSISLKSGVIEFLDLLKASGIKTGIATSNTMMLVDTVLKKNNIFHYFDNITTTDEVGKGKGSPDVYFLCAKKMGVNPEECIVFEDILPAVKTAKLAGMKVVGVYDNYSENNTAEIIQLADRYIQNFHELMDVI